MISFVNITGKKETKSVQNNGVTVGTVQGNFKLGQDVQDTLGIKDGDFVLTVIHPEDRSRVFIAKGIRGEAILDENGRHARDARNRALYVDNTCLGALVRPTAEGSSVLTFSASEAWRNLGGNTEFNKVFTISEGVEGAIPTGNGDELHSTLFFELLFKEDSAKIARKGSKDASDVEVEDFEEVATDMYEEEV